MTLRQAQQMPGFYGRLVKPWKPYSDEPLMHEIALVRADRTILDANPMSPISPDASPYDDWQPVDATLLLSAHSGETDHPFRWQTDHLFRRKPITRSDANRSPVGAKRRGTKS